MVLVIKISRAPPGLPLPLFCVVVVLCTSFSCSSQLGQGNTLNIGDDQGEMSSLVRDKLVVDTHTHTYTRDGEWGAFFSVSYEYVEREESGGI